MKISGGTKQYKNIRSMLKTTSASSVKPATAEKFICGMGMNFADNPREHLNVSSNEGEISFNITPEEEEIKRDAGIDVTKSRSGNARTCGTSERRDDNDDEEVITSQYQKEAKELIEKTRKMMETLDVHKLNENFPTEYVEEKPIDSSKIVKMERDDLLNKTTGNINNSNTSNSNVNTLNIRLLEKIKYIKSLEKELKEKNILIDKLNAKLDKQYEEIKKINEKLNAEKNSTLKNENAALNKKLKEKDEELSVKGKLMNNLIDEYKKKIENLITTNENGLEKMKELETKNKALREQEKKYIHEINNYKAGLTSMENQLKHYKENFEVEIKEKVKIEEKKRNLSSCFKTIAVKLLEILQEEDKRNEKKKEIWKKMGVFFENGMEEEINLKASGMSQSSQISQISTSELKKID